MSPNTNIVNSVVNAEQTIKVLFTWRHNVAPNSTCKTIKSSTLFWCRKRVKFYIYFTFNNLVFVLEWNKRNKQKIIDVFKIRYSQNVFTHDGFNDNFLQPTGTAFRETEAKNKLNYQTSSPTFIIMIIFFHDVWY
jgi:hypothetical protein